eukprot:381406_1
MSNSIWLGHQHQLFSDKIQRGILIDGTEEKNATKALRHPRAKEGLWNTFLIDDENNQLDTVWKLFNISYTKHANDEYSGFRPWTDADNDINRRGSYTWMRYKDFGDYAIDFGCALRTLGITDQSNIGIFSVNRPEWYVAHMGNLSQSYSTVPLYNNLDPDAVSYIVHHAQVPVIVTEKNKLKILFSALQNVKNKVSCSEEEKGHENGFCLKYIIQIDYDEIYGNTHEKLNKNDIKTAKEEFNCELLGLGELLKKGKSVKDEFYNKNLPRKDHIACIMYTAGTTSDPKGVVLTHQSVAASVATLSRLNHYYDLTPNDIHCSYMPLAHTFELTIMTSISAHGAKVAYYQGSIKNLEYDWKDIRPTILIGLPTIFNKIILEKFKLKVSKFGSVKKWFVESAQEASSKEIRQGRRNHFYDKYVWNSVGEEMGLDRVRITLLSITPLTPHLAEFLRIVLPKSPVSQLYGLTECCCVATVCDAGDLTLGHVGLPIDAMELRLIDAPECGFYTTDAPYPRGEIQLRGLNLMNGYYKNEEATNKVLNKETGWFSTGDIGRINPNGTISILDTQENIFRTSMGEYIQPQKIESVYERAELVGQVWIYGNSFKSFIIAIVVPNPQVLVQKLREYNLWNQDIMVATKQYRIQFKKVCEKNRRMLKKLIIANMKRYENELNKFERIKDIYLEFTINDLLQGFGVDNNLLTPTYKKKRKQLLQKYVDNIKQLHADNGEPPTDYENWFKISKPKQRTNDPKNKQNDDANNNVEYEAIISQQNQWSNLYQSEGSYTLNTLEILAHLHDNNKPS